MLQDTETILTKTVSLTKSGQISLPRDVANVLDASYGKDRIVYDVKKDGTVTISRQQGLLECLEDLRADFSEAEKAAVRRMSGRPIRDLLEEIDDLERNDQFSKRPGKHHKTNYFERER